MRSRFQYIRPNSLQEAIAFLAENGPRTAILAGGTDLSIAIRKGDVDKDYVLDISRLDETRTIEIANGNLAVGAAVTYTEIVGNPTVNRHAPLLAAAARCVGSLQIRNMGTLGGNVANASPAADSVPAMMAHNVRVLIQSEASERGLPLDQVIMGPYVTSLQPGELITKFFFEPMDSGYRYSFQRIARRRALSIARANAAAMALQDTGGTVLDLRLSVGSITPRPCRLVEAEQHLVGKVPSFNLLREAAELVSHEMVRRSGVRASTEYKKPAVEGLVIKALSEVFHLPAPMERMPGND
jgi:CO/xanthine dehydrogenase FAD-binding subunit